MEKLKIEIEYLVPYADTDQMGVVYYANYFVYFERARNELLKQAGFPYSEMEKDGFMLPVLEARCNYYISAHYDDNLVILAWFENFKGPRVTIFCEVYRGNDLLVKGYTTHSFVNVLTRKPVRPPKKIRRFVEDNFEKVS